MRSIVSVATGPFVKGLDRLTEWCAANTENYLTWRDKLPAGSPSHKDMPYAFKAFALKEASRTFDTMLYCDASIIPVQPLARVWEQIERDGYLIFNNGWSNYEWTAYSAYPALFPSDTAFHARDINRTIQHVVGGCIGLSLAHPTGRAILDEYYRLATTTKAFCGPWINDSNNPCGPTDVRGHRHDQTALSVIAWRLACKLTNPPDIFAYGKAGDNHDERTVLIADGSY